MKDTALQASFWIFFVLLPATSCVSVQLPSSAPQKAEGVKFVAPAKPFESFSPPHLDGAWKNPSNGNSISFLSDCDPKSDPSLDTIQSGILQGIQGLVVEKTEYTKYNHRQALASQVRGEVDGIPSKLKLVIFRKNQCIYVITYVALDKTFSTNVSEFENFLNKFEAP